jgi:hypothetical protein
MNEVKPRVLVVGAGAAGFSALSPPPGAALKCSSLTCWGRAANSRTPASLRRCPGWRPLPGPISWTRWWAASTGSTSLGRLGFSQDEADELSALHTRNFM